MNGIIIKTPEEIEKMRELGRLVAEALDYIGQFVKPGVTTNEIDKLVYDYHVNKKDGFHGDSSRMFTVGKVSPIAQRLIDVTHASMMAGIEAVKPGATLGDVGYACQQVAENAGYSVVQEFCGHGIGRGFHEAPQVLHYGQKGQGPVLKPGMIFTIEPMINQGKRHLRILNDGWTVVTKDRSLSAQWEHEVLVTETGHEILTISPVTGKP